MIYIDNCIIAQALILKWSGYETRLDSRHISSLLFLFLVSEQPALGTVVKKEASIPAINHIFLLSSTRMVAIQLNSAQGEQKGLQSLSGVDIKPD